MRSVVVGLAVGSLLCCTNLYLGLQSAFITMASMQAALVGFAIVSCASTGKRESHTLGENEETIAEENTTEERGLTALKWLGAPFSAQENVVLQATAVSLGATPLCAGLIGIVPAFNLLSPTKDGDNVHPFTFSWLALSIWCASMA